ncbi:choice-of-anchor L domain-containing protein, partial [Flavobacterium sp.]|uniref:choice-of-anchor L domain-containing protein n=1 Tax=Flavobacterium sp. TaxID=239 RepID=UPI00334273E5
MKKITISILLLFFSGILFSQSISVNTGIPVSQLVQNVLIDSPCAQVSNFTTQGNCGIGKFTFGGSPVNFPFQDGVIIRSGTAVNSSGNYTDSNNSTICSGLTDVELRAINIANGNNGTINDASFIKFNFTPFTDNFSFNFIFASNEYGAFQCGYSDVFAFILTDVTPGVTTPAQNLAVIPGTTTPVSVTNIRNNAFNANCPSVNPTYFSVYTPNVTPASNTVMNMRGYTVPMTASATVIPNHNYTIKLVIGDYTDSDFDSAVFIEGGSFNIGLTNLTYPIGTGGSYSQDMLVSNGQAICPGQSRVISTGLSAANFDFVWTRNGVNLNIDAPSITVSSPGTYCVSASVTGGGACSQTDCIVVEYFTGFSINQTPPNMVVCNPNVNLTTQNNSILAGLDTATHDVEYYFSMADAMNPSSIPFTTFIATLGTTQTIVAKVTNIFAACPEYATFTVTYINNNTVTAPSTSPTLCINTALPAITHTTTGATGIGTATGLPAGVTASWAANTITISGSPSVIGTFNYSIPLTGGCGAVNATGTIIVTTANTSVTAPTATPSLCINTALTAITHTTTGATGIGIATGLPAGVTASWATNTITISGTPTASGTFAYTIPLTGGCSTVNAIGTITVTTANTVTAPSATPTLCINTALTAITHTTTGATGIGTATGLPAGVTASWAANTITISGTPTASGTFAYSIPLTGGCGTVSAIGTITVTPNNTVTGPSATPTLCINTALTAITHTTTGATGIGTATGLPAGVTASWSANTITISGTPTASGTFAYSIPLTGGCSTVNAIGTITVTPNNTVTAPTATPTLCINTALTAITHTTTGATGIGTATGLPAGVTASWASNTITISGTPTASGTFAYSIP